MTDTTSTAVAAAADQGPLNPADLTARTVHRAGTPDTKHLLHYYWAGIWIIDQTSGLWGPTGYANTLEGWSKDGWVVDYAQEDVTDRVAFSPFEACGSMHPLHHNTNTGLWRMDPCTHPGHTVPVGDPAEMSLIEWEQRGWHISTPAAATSTGKDEQ